MRRRRLRIGERLARDTVTIVDGPLPGDYAAQPFSANGAPRETVTLIDRGVLANGLGDPFTPDESGITSRSACRAASFRDRPSPRMTNIRIEVAGAAELSVEPELLTAEAAAETLHHAGLLERGQPTLFLRGYRGGQAHPRRGDFIFAADAAFDLGEAGAPRSAVSFSGLAERALAAIVAGFGPLSVGVAGTCQKNGSGVSSSGGSHTLLVLDSDPELVVTAAR
jgi:TldD protein